MLRPITPRFICPAGCPRVRGRACESLPRRHNFPILATAPIHWVSVPMIAASLDGKPPMVVGFDIDDTVLFSSPCFYYGQMKYSPGSDNYLGIKIHCQ